MVGAVVHRPLSPLWVQAFPRQRSTTIMVKAPRRLFDAVVWRQFSDVHTDLWTYFEQTTERLIREAIHTDKTDAEVAPEPIGLR
jgi:hypothetical protein